MTLLRLDQPSGDDRLPAFDRATARAGILHIGPGGFHRSHMARYTHDLMAIDPAASEWGIAAAGLMPADAALIDTLNRQHGLYTLVEQDQSGSEATVIGSVVEALFAGETTAALLGRLDDPAIRIVSLTVTEHGYCLDRATKRLDLDHPTIRADLATPASPKSAIGVIVEAARRRRDAGTGGFTALSCDNIQHNGAVLKGAVLALADARDPGLAHWITGHVSFPSTMVDRITPVPLPQQSEDVERDHGIADGAPVLCEAFRQWVIEDDFIAGRPDWDRVGAQFVADVSPYEFMKLRLLNASHLAISGLGRLMGHVHVHDAMADPALAIYMQALMDTETGPTLLPVPGIDLAAYKASLVARFANPAIRDTVERVNTDAALNYLLDPIRDRLAADQAIPLLALGLAAWMRRVAGTDEQGAPIDVRHPLAADMRTAAIAGRGDPAPLLAMTALFGDLGQDRRLHDAVAPWLAALHAHGAHATLAKVVAA